MTYLVIHKGFKNVMYENSLVGILAVIFKQKFCELDILFVKGQWKICHDFHALSIYHSSLSELVVLLKEYETKIQNNIILDVKWDFVGNQHDNLYDAIGLLKHDLASFEDNPHVWIQASSPKMLDVFLQHQLEYSWEIGLILQRIDDFYLYRDWLYYVMVSLTDFSFEEIQIMSEEKLVFGYTCHDPIQFSHYKHLFPYVRGIVCDVSV